jgi:uncharacterized protein (DUF2461 family)
MTVSNSFFIFYFLCIVDDDGVASGGWWQPYSYMWQTMMVANSFICF